MTAATWISFLGQTCAAAGFALVGVAIARRGPPKVDQFGRTMGALWLVTGTLAVLATWGWAGLGLLVALAFVPAFLLLRPGPNRDVAIVAGIATVGIAVFGLMVASGPVQDGPPLDALDGPTGREVLVTKATHAWVRGPCRPLGVDGSYPLGALTDPGSGEVMGIVRECPDDGPLQLVRVGRMPTAAMRLDLKLAENAVLWRVSQPEMRARLSLYGAAIFTVGSLLPLALVRRRD